ncbi:MAG: ABC transporter permease, partial [Bdellovibrio sp.]
MSSNEMTMDNMEITANTLSAKDRAEMETALPMWKMVFNQFLEHRLAVAGAVIITLFILISVLAEPIQYATGLDPDVQNVAHRYLAPFTTAQASQDVRETAVEHFITVRPEQADVIQKALVEKNIVAVAEADAIYELALQEPAQALSSLKSLDLPATQDLISVFKDFETFHLFGTDELGRDVFIRLVYGTRVSMGVGILVALASALIGLLIGSIAGFYGGTIDTILMRVTDALLSLPTIPVLIVMAAIDLSKIPWLKAMISTSNESIVKMVIILCLFSWMTVARLVRGSILSIREREFVLAARTLGAQDSTII